MPKHQMVSLKMTKKQSKAREKVMYSTGSSGESYPWGTRLDFEKPDIDKIKALQDVSAGDEVDIRAVGKVTEIRVTDAEKGRSRHTVEVQITKIGIYNKDEETTAFEEEDGDEY